MSTMKSTLAATLLTVVFAVPALGGNIGSPGGTPTPPPPPPPLTESGNIGSPGLPAPVDANSVPLSSQVLVDILTGLLFLL
jgi:hypothetical protein